MKLLNLNEFLKLFDNDDFTFQEFLNNYQVKIGEKIIPIKEYIKNKEIDKSKIKLLFENIKNRNDYLTRFYNTSLRVNYDDISIRNPPMKNKEFNNNQLVNYKNLIRNMHYKHILENTTSGIDNVPSFLNVLKDLYLNNIIDYKILTPSGIFYMQNGRLGSVFSSYFFRASIMNPYLVYSLNKSLLKGTKIFTPTLGWSSYCYGFLECEDVTEYVGTDVIPNVCKKTKDFANEKYPNKIVEIFCSPSENLLKKNAFCKKYREHFDLVFFSPPYYKLEQYKSENQSIDKYKTYEEWLIQYWEETIKLCSYVLKKNGKLCYILSGYGSNNTDSYDLLSDMNRITKKYFHYKGEQSMFNKDVHVTMHKETNEKIVLFNK